MGNNQSTLPYKFRITLKTGQYVGQNVSGKGNVCMRFYGKDPDTEVSDVFTCSGRRFLQGSEVYVDVSAAFDQIDQLEVWIERTGNDPNLNWFVDIITCEESKGNKTVFPFRRWVTLRHQLIAANDCELPQRDRNAERRHEAVFMDRNWFYFANQAGGIPILTDTTSNSEKFSKEYFMNVFLKQGILNKIKEFLLPLFTGSWNDLRDTANIYGRCCLSFKQPKAVATYMNVLPKEPTESFDQTELDKLFGAQRLTGTNPVVIERVKSTSELIEDSQRVNPSDTSLEDMLQPLMEGLTIQEAVNEKKLYKVDYTDVLHNLPCKTGMIAAPFALFFVNSENNLMPIAIQLFKQLRGSPRNDNPIFVPDDSYTWLLAKMWFNNADASYHQSVSHLGFTHLLMETVYIALRQTVSLSHPLYRLMAPHFLYLINIDVEGWDLLLQKGAFVDEDMSIGVKGMLEIIRRKFEGMPDKVTPWRLNVEGNIEKDIEARGVEHLPNYTFRDDALAVHKIIKKYVKTTVDSTYTDPQDLIEDYEMQAWGEMLQKKTADGGCGIKGLAFEEKTEDGQKIYFSTKEEVVDTITSVIYTCSAAHAAVNFLQYEEYGYPLNYPALLYGDPPRSKPKSQKDHLTEKDILQALPTKQQTLNTMNVTNVLSQMSTVDRYLKNQLGHFPIQYQYTADGGTPQNVIDFQEDLKELAIKIGTRNDPYHILSPENIPNSISI